jgi:hypothetical protein
VATKARRDNNTLDMVRLRESAAASRNVPPAPGRGKQK